MIKKIILFVIILLLTLSLVIAENLYYADVNIEVIPTGFVTINGVSNHPSLNIKETDIYTSKKSNYWVINITLPDKFSNYVYSVNFPESTVINYLKTPTSVRIENIGGKISLKAIGKDEEFYFIAQYTINKQNSVFTKFNLYNVILLTFILIFILIGIRLLYKKKGIKKVPHYNPASLTETQSKIIDFIKKQKLPITQKSIEKELNIPKATLSRNIDILVGKGIIMKEQKGMTNIIYFVTKEHLEKFNADDEKIPKNS